jgi:hypothetical protein
LRSNLSGRRRKLFFMPILVGFAGPFHSPRSYTTADVSSVNDHRPRD